MRRKPKASSLTTMADTEFRFLIRERDNYLCRKCGSPGSNFAPLEVAHFVGRAKFRTRWNPENAALLCKTPCHSFLDTHPLAKDEWIEGQIGREKYRELRAMAEDGTKTNVKEVLDDLRAQRKVAK